MNKSDANCLSPSCYTINTRQKTITFRTKSTKKKLKGQSRVVKYSFQQVDVASSLSKNQASMVLHSFIATFPGNNISKYSVLNTVAKYMNKQGFVKLENLAVLLKKQGWEVIDKQKDIAICEFAYKAGSWKEARVLKAIRTVKKYVETDFLEKVKLPLPTNTLVISALMGLMQQGCTKFTSNVQPAKHGSNR